MRNAERNGSNAWMYARFSTPHDRGTIGIEADAVCAILGRAEARGGVNDCCDRGICTNGRPVFAPIIRRRSLMIFMGHRKESTNCDR